MENFTEWLNSILENDLPDTIQAINFNIYDDEDGIWSIELIGASRFDADDPDWACDEVFTTREEPLTWEEDTSWENIQQQTLNAVKEYLENGKYAKLLKSYQGIGAGFVDGELFVLYRSENK